MRRHYRRRSTVTWIIWGSAFLGIVLLMAWQFRWFPNGEIETGVLVTDEDDDRQRRDDDLRRRGRGDESVDPAVFASQTEPTGDDEPDFLSHGPPAESRVPPRPLFAGEFDDPPSRGLPDRPPTARHVDGGPRPSGAGEPTVGIADDAAGDAGLRGGRNSRPVRSAGPAESSRLQQADFERHGIGGGVESRIVQAGNEVPAASRVPAEDSPPAEEPAASDGPPSDWLRKIDGQLEAGEYLAAHKELSKAYWDHPEWRDALQSRLDKPAASIYFSPQPDYIPPYTVEPGDLLSTIAKKYKVTWRYLERLNRTDARRIRPGQKLKVLKGPFSAVVDLGRHELTVHHYGYVVRRYRVGIGRDGTTPIGTFKVLDKVINPDYYGTDERSGRRFIVNKDDPENPLGERWIDLGDSYGIHGTIDPDSIGKDESKGCIRMLNEEVEEVFDFLDLGSEVVIQR